MGSSSPVKKEFAAPWLTLSIFASSPVPATKFITLFSHFFFCSQSLAQALFFLAKLFLFVPTKRKRLSGGGRAVQCASLESWSLKGGASSNLVLRVRSD